MNRWTPLWSMIVDSSLWQDEDDATCKVFITMMALKDPDHVVRMSAYQIGKKANKTEAEVLAAFKLLSAPDKKRLEPQEFDGRRIEKRPDGWFMLNGQKYQEMMQDMIRQKQQAQWMRDERMIMRAVRTGEGIPPERLTPSVQARFEKAKKKRGAKPAPEPVQPIRESDPFFTHDGPTGETGVADLNSSCGFDPNATDPEPVQAGPEKICLLAPDGTCPQVNCPQIAAGAPANKCPYPKPAP